MSGKRERQLNALKSFLHVINYEQFNSDGLEQLKLKVGNNEFVEVDLFDLLFQLYTALNEGVPMEFDNIDNYISDSLLDIKSENERNKAELDYWKNQLTYYDPRD